MRRLATCAGAGRVVEAAGADLWWRSMIPICHMPHLRSDPYIEGDKEPYFPDPQRAIWQRVGAIAPAEAMSLKTTSSGAVRCSVNSCAPLPSLKSETASAPGLCARCDRLQLRPVSNDDREYHGLPSAF